MFPFGGSVTYIVVVVVGGWFDVVTLVVVVAFSSNFGWRAMGVKFKQFLLKFFSVDCAHAGWLVGLGVLVDRLVVFFSNELFFLN